MLRSSSKEDFLLGLNILEEYDFVPEKKKSKRLRTIKGCLKRIFKDVKAMGLNPVERQDIQLQITRIHDKINKANVSEK